MTVGQLIRDRREELGMSQDDLAKKMGWKSRNSICRYEQMDNLKLSVVEKFADALAVPPSYFMGWSDKEGNELPDSIQGDAEDSAELVRLFLMLDDKNKDNLINYAKFLLSGQ